MTATRKTAAALAATLLLAGALAGCTSGDSSAQKSGQQQTEQAFKQQSGAVPYPVGDLRDSLERRNLREKLLRYNNPSKISYIYLMTQTGGIYAYFTIKGKVSSNQSQMTADQLDIDRGSYGQAVVNAPGDDGSYGLNEDGIFFFTTDGVMVTWNGQYLLTDAPLKVNAQNLVVSYVEGSKPSSTSGK
jgi:hypothetical protein